MLFDLNLVGIQGNFDHSVVKNQSYFSHFLVAWNSYSSFMGFTIKKSPYSTASRSSTSAPGVAMMKPSPKRTHSSLCVSFTPGTVNNPSDPILYTFWEITIIL
jgi:hypothetical protein